MCLQGFFENLKSSHLMINEMLYYFLLFLRILLFLNNNAGIKLKKLNFEFYIFIYLFIIIYNYNFYKKHNLYNIYVVNLWIFQ